MSKGQINYLLALATLVVCWLYFNTFFCGAKKNYAGMPMGGMMASPGGRFPNPGGMQNIPQLPNINELLKYQSRGMQTSAAPGRMPSASSEAPRMGDAANS